MMDEHRIQTDELSAMSIDEWVDEQCTRGNLSSSNNEDDTRQTEQTSFRLNEGEVQTEMRDRLLDDTHNGETDVYLDDGATVVVDTDEFTGSHVASADGRTGEWHVDEVGFYIHDETDWELEIGCPIDVTRLEDEVREYHSGEHYGEAALTVGERNPSLGGRKL